MTVGICVIAFASVGVAHAQRVDEQERLNDELAVAKLRLSKIKLEELNVQQLELEEELTLAISELEATKVELSQPNESIPVSGELFDIAEACNVEIIEVSSQGLGEDELGDIECSFLPVVLRAEGSTSNLIRFARKLNDDFRSGYIESVEIAIPAAPEEVPPDEEQPEEVQSPSVNVNMIIYSYEGS